MSISADINDFVHLLGIGGKDLFVRALPLGETMEWCKDAAMHAELLCDAETHEEIAEALGGIARFIETYPLLTEGKRNTVPEGTIDGASTAQIEGALEALRILNDPLYRKAKAKEAANARGLEMLKLIPEKDRSDTITQALGLLSAQ